MTSDDWTESLQRTSDHYAKHSMQSGRPERIGDDLTCDMPDCTNRQDDWCPLCVRCLCADHADRHLPAHHPTSSNPTTSKTPTTKTGSTMSSDCPHGMPTPGACLDCMADGNLPQPQPPESETADSRPFASRFDGHCGACNLPVSAGQRIVHTTKGRYVHEGCAA